jgi:hypothetical protein
MIIDTHHIIGYNTKLMQKFEYGQVYKAVICVSLSQGQAVYRGQ